MADEGLRPGLPLDRPVPSLVMLWTLRDQLGASLSPCFFRKEGA